MGRDPFGHRKYHGLYFILGFLIAVVLVLMVGCDRAETTGGVVETPCCQERVCCQAMIPQCMACQDSCSIDEWLVKTCGENAVGAEYAGWDEELNEPIWICQAEIIN